MFDWPCTYRGEPTGKMHKCDCPGGLKEQPVLHCLHPALGRDCVVHTGNFKRTESAGLSCCADCQFRDGPAKPSARSQPVAQNPEGFVVPPRPFDAVAGGGRQAPIPGNDPDFVVPPRPFDKYRAMARTSAQPNAICLPMWTRRIDTSSLPFANVFNASMLQRGDQRFLVFRGDSNRIGIVEVGKDWQLHKSHKVLKFPVVRENGRHGGWFEDPRVVLHDGKVLVSYVGVDNGWRGTICLAELDDNFNVVNHVVPRYERRTSTEKNWSWFSTPGGLRCVYQTAPEHRILRVWGDEVLDDFTAEWTPQWDAGHLRGGASPVLHNGQWYSFIHGVTERPRFYSVGLYTFSAEPPYAPLRCIPRSILAVNLAEQPHGRAIAVFPCGALYDAESDSWLVSYGYFDSWTYVASWPAKQLEEALKVVE